MKPCFNIRPLRESEFTGIIELGNKVHGDNYVSYEGLDKILHKSIKNDRSCSFSLTRKDDHGEKVVGFRLTYAPGMWEPDKWCTPEQWGLREDEVCYFKSNTIDESLRGSGLGSLLLRRSIEEVKLQGGKAGITHIWMQSPGNSAYKYFTKAGGKVIEIHPDRWTEDYINDGYICSVCQAECHCEGTEMILYFEE